jgi:hypothetical protein
MRSADEEIPSWDFGPAIDLLKTLTTSESRHGTPTPFILSEPSGLSDPPLVLSQADDEDLSLGNFSRIWEYLSLSRSSETRHGGKSADEDAECVAKEVRWRDEVSGADLEDNVDVEQGLSAASLRTKKRSERRARARDRASRATVGKCGSYETGSESANIAETESAEESDTTRRSPDRRAVIQDILHRSDKNTLEDPPSPPTSPSPPKGSLRVLRKEWPISNPFQWSTSTGQSSSHANQFRPVGNLSPEQRKSKLISRLAECYPSEGKYLKNKGLIHPEFTPLNTSDSGVHVFVDISNVRFHFLTSSLLC